MGRVILYLSCMRSYSRVYAESELSQPQCHATIPAQRVSIGSLGRRCPPFLSHRKERQGGWHVHFCTATVGKERVGEREVMAQAGVWAGDSSFSQPGDMLWLWGKRSWESSLGSCFLNCQCSADLSICCCCFLQSRLESMRLLEAF